MDAPLESHHRPPTEPPFELPVELVRWPSESARREALARGAVPRILLVGASSPPPDDLAFDEDWLPESADASTIVGHAERLHQACARLDHDEPFVDDQRVLHRADRAVHLSSTEATIITILLRNRGTVVSVSDLEQCVWGIDRPNRDALSAAMYRLRGRLVGLRLVIRAVRGRGFVIDAD